MITDVFSSTPDRFRRAGALSRAYVPLAVQFAQKAVGQTVLARAARPRFVTAFLVATTLTLLVQGAAAQTGITSDDFSSTTINSSVWTPVDPAGDAVIMATGTQAALSVPAGSDHDAWQTGNNTARLMQAAPNTNFEIEVKFESALTRGSQIQGILVEETTTRYLRFDFLYNGSQLYAFAAFLNGGSSSVKLNQPISQGASMWLRITRSSNTWTYRYSLNGTSWTTAGSFSQTLSVTKVGPYAGNHGGGNAPPHTALVDYFFNTAAPISLEDGTALPDVTAPVISDVAAAPSGASAKITWTTNEPTTTRLNYGLTASYGSFIQQSSPEIYHQLEITGLAEGTQYHFQIEATDQSSNDQASSDYTFTTTSLAPQINVWYGLDQHVRFDGQNDFNLLGEVADPQSTTMTYSVNGGAPQALTVGYRPDGYGDGRRLAKNGDWNADIPLSSLQNGMNTIELTATNAGHSSNVDVDVTVDLNPAPLPTNVSWSTVGNPQDVGQYIDGHWIKEANGLRIVETGYDRLFEIGDRWWQDYEVVAPVTINALDSQMGPGDPNGGPGVGFLFRWQGHTENGYQPKWWYWPFGLITWITWEKPGGGIDIESDPYLEAYKGASIASPDGLYGQVPVNVGQTYWMKARCETLPDTPSGEGVTLYSYKIWPVGSTEPGSWNFEHEQTSSEALRTGGLVLIAHHVDATFGDVSITPLSGGPPPDVTPPVLSNISASAGTTTATISWTTDEPATSRVDYGLDTNYGSTAENLTLKTSHSLPISGLTPETLYHYRVSSTDASGNPASSSDFTFTTGGNSSGITSDDFSSPSLNTSLWTFVNPLGDASVSATGTQAALSIPGGANHDPWGSNNTAPRLMQAATNTDFEIEVKFESSLSAQIQSQGLLVEESPSRYIRFDVYHSGSNYMAFSAYINGGSGSIKVNQAIPGGTPLWLRVTRTGTTWTYRYSLNGSSWTTATTFSQTLSVSKVGVFGGNFGGGGAPAHTALVDYFFNTASPIVPEDGTSDPDETPPVISDVAAEPGTTTATVTWTTDEPATSRVDYGLDSGYGSVTENLTLKTNHSLTISGLSAETLYHYRVSSTDFSDNTATSNDFTFTTTSVPTGITSDDFSSPTLNTSLWTFVNPLGDASVSVTGTQAALSVPSGTNHDPWGSNNTAARLMQAATNIDFEVEVKFESALTTQIQGYGLLVEESLSRYIRFDVYYNGSSYQIFCAYLNGGSGSVKVNQAIQGGTPLWLRVTRAGNTWTYRYSRNGTSWTTATTFSQALSVAKAGVFAGNFGGGSAPANTVIVDYFFNTAAPIVPEDGGAARIASRSTESASDLSGAVVAAETLPLASNLRAAPVGGDVVLTWTTSVPGAAFEVQSGAGELFETITTVYAESHPEDAGNPYDFRQELRYVVRNAAPGTHRYRIRQIQPDEIARQSEVVEVEVLPAEAYRLGDPYPNPFSAGSELTLTVREAQRVRVDVYDALGRRVSTLFDQDLPANSSHRIRLDATGLSSGLYVIRAEGESFADHRRIVLLK